MALQDLLRYSFHDYLATEREAIDEKHEYVAGRVYAMTGASYHHNLITTNLAAALHAQLKGRPCVVMTNDMRVRIESADACKYPDIVALCGEPRFHDEHTDVLMNPVLVAEVLSPSSEAYAHDGEFAIYRALPSLQEYVLIAQDRPSVELFARQPNERWLLTTHGSSEDEVRLDSLACKVRLAEIYDRVRFADPDVGTEEVSARSSPDS